MEEIDFLGYIKMAKNEFISQRVVVGFPTITPIIARLFESVLAEWVMNDVKPHIDHRQFGNIKGSSVTHYLISPLDENHRGLA